MELLEILFLVLSAKMVGATKLLVKFLSMEVSNLSESLIFGVADCCISSVFGIMMSPQGGAVVVSLVTMEILVPL